MKIAVDVMGGDFAPKAIVEGAVIAANQLPEGVKLVLIGKQGIMLDILRTMKYPAHAIEMVNADDVIEMGEHPTRAFSQKPNSSIGVGFKLLKEGNVNAFCSAGNTGALMATARFVLKMLPGVDRPAMVSALPTIIGKPAYMLDLGANVESTGLPK